MQENALTLLGKIIKVHGYQGALVIALEGDFSDEIEKMESVFVVVDGIPVPFFIENIKETGKRSVVIKFDYYDSDSKVSEFIACSVLAPFGIDLKPDSEDLPLEFIGFKILNKDNIELGTIAKVLSFPMQVLFELNTLNADQILVPYNRDWVIKIDNKKRIILLDWPDGLDTFNR